MPGTFHFAAPDDLEGLALARLISRLGVEHSSACTFLWDESGDLAADWESWLRSWFAPVLAPPFAKIHRLAGQIRTDEISLVDYNIDAALSEPLRQRSLVAASAFLSGKTEMRANREWSHFAERVEQGKSPGHTATLFALQTALYHLPLAPALAAYAWFELESGLPRNRYRDRRGSGEKVLTVFAAAIPHVRVAMQTDRDDFADGQPQLRAI